MNEPLTSCNPSRRVTLQVEQLACRRAFTRAGRVLAAEPRCARAGARSHAGLPEDGCRHPTAHFGQMVFFMHEGVAELLRDRTAQVGTPHRAAATDSVSAGGAGERRFLAGGL